MSVDFTPEVTVTALAKGIAGAMVGLALLMVLSLPWMARRVHKRGSFGRKASATLRSLYPIVLGLGGWLLGVLIVMTTMPGVPLDNAWTAQAKTTGFTIAAGAAVLGAWPGTTQRLTYWRSSPRSWERQSVQTWP